MGVVDLSNGVPEQVSGGLLGLSQPRVTLEAVGHDIEELGHDKDVRAVIVRLGTAQIGLARGSEVAGILAKLGAKVPVWCHAETLDNPTFYLAARGCSRLWLSPAGGVDAIGIAAQTVYFHKLLAEELGFSVDFLQVGKFKGAEEPFTRDGPSPEARESLTSTLSDLRTRWLEGLRASRSRPSLSAFEDGPYSAPEAKARGLIDDVGYFDEARAALIKRTGAVRTSVRLGPGAVSGGNDWASGIQSLVGDSLGTAAIVVVPAIGAITMEAGSPLGGGGGIVEHQLARVLSRLEKDEDVKAVVLRVDSPGGSALASDLLWHDLMRIRAKKTLVVSVGDMAASGGFYLASTGAAVFADEASIVGSIGVVGGKIAINRALERVGIHAETFAAKPDDDGAAARAATESLLMPWDELTRARVFATMSDIYALFLSRVSEGRGISVERVAASAEGRIFSGREGKARGLIDEMGGLREAIERARSLARLPLDARVEVAGEPAGWFRALGLEEDQPSSRGAGSWIPFAGNAKEAISQQLLRLAPEALPFVESVWPLAQREHTLCAMPFMLTVR